MKKIFEEPKVEILEFAVNDVITTSVEEEPPIMIGDCL